MWVKVLRSMVTWRLGLLEALVVALAFGAVDAVVAVDKDDDDCCEAGS